MSNDELPLVKLCKEAHATPAVSGLGCSGCVKFFAKSMGIDLPNVKANPLIDHMKTNWTSVTKDQAQNYADLGRLVVAGKKNSSGDGHVVVVLPGGPVASGGYIANKGKSKGKKLSGRGKYPRACSMTSSADPWIGAISQGEYSTFDPWYGDEGVEYWVAPKKPGDQAKATSSAKSKAT